MSTTNPANNTQSSRDRFYFRLIAAISLVVLVTVILLNRRVLPRPEVLPSFTYFLPKLNAIINGTCCILLLISFYFIRRKKIAIHKAINITTFVLSAIFLVSYIAYHWMADHTVFPADNPLHTLYVTILYSHIVLAALVFPLILFSFYHGLQMHVATHKKLVRWTFPIWLYVTATGVIVYLMISPYYPV